MLCIRLLCPALLSLALLLPGVAAGAVPEKPADHILDQAGALGNTEKQNLAAELQKTDAERTQEANNESDRIKALTRLAKCKADPASC